MAHLNFPDTFFCVIPELDSGAQGDPRYKWLRSADLVASNPVLRVKSLETLEASVVDPAGKPVIGAQVVLKDSNRPLRLGKGAIILWGSQPLPPSTVMLAWFTRTENGRWFGRRWSGS